MKLTSQVSRYTPFLAAESFEFVGEGIVGVDSISMYLLHLLHLLHERWAQIGW